MKSGYRSCGLAAASSSALGISRRKITHTSTSIWAMPVRSSAPIALRYSFSIRAWVHTKLIRQIVLTVTWTELKSSNQRQAPSSCRLAWKTTANACWCAGPDRRDGSVDAITIRPDQYSTHSRLCLGVGIVERCGRVGRRRIPTTRRERRSGDSRRLRS